MKADTIKEILKQTGANPEKVFDKLDDKSEKYLKKLLKVIDAL